MDQFSTSYICEHSEGDRDRVAQALSIVFGPVSVAHEGYLCGTYRSPVAPQKLKGLVSLLHDLDVDSTFFVSFDSEETEYRVMFYYSGLWGKSYYSVDDGNSDWVFI
jgi:hypothetical protein